MAAESTIVSSPSAISQSAALSSHWSDSIIQIRVGAEKTVFFVHKQKLCQLPWFERCLNGAFQGTEARTGIVDLPEENAAAFGRIVNYLYDGKISENLAAIATNTIHTLRRETRLLAGTYLLADKLCAESLCNSIIDALRLRHSIISPYNLAILMAHGPPESELLRLMLRKIGYRIQKEGWTKFMTRKNLDSFIHASTENAIRIGKAVSDYGMLPNPTKLSAADGCQFHKHLLTPKCNSKKRENESGKSAKGANITKAA